MENCVFLWDYSPALIHYIFNSQLSRSLHSKQVLAAKLTQPLLEWMGKFEPHKNKEISLPVFCFTEWRKCQDVSNTCYLVCAEKTLKN